MVEELDTGRLRQLRGELQVLLVQARVEQLAHGGTRWQLRVTYFGLGHGWMNCAVSMASRSTLSRTTKRVDT